MTAPPLRHLRTGRARLHSPALLGEAAPRGAAADRRSVAWFVALVTALAAGSVVATSAMPALVPFVLAIGPAFIALGIAWREGDGAARRLLAHLVRRPTRRAWYLVIGLPAAAAVAKVLIGIAFGYAKENLFGAVMPALLIVPLVVLIPAFAEELAWRGFATSS